MIVYFFIDGVGFGENDIEKNPFAKFAKGFFLPLANKPLPTNSKLTEGAYIKTDASMGIKGLPQSATGQTAIWTGINAPQVRKCKEKAQTCFCFHNDSTGFKDSFSEHGRFTK